MATLEFKPKSPWENKFRQPDEDELRSQYLKPVQAVLAGARAAMLTFEDAREDLEWLGIPWRWSYVYRTGSGTKAAMAYVVPQPERPRIAIPVSAMVLSKVPARKLSKFIREGVLHAPMVGEVRWAQWELTATGQIEEVLALLALHRQAQQPAAVG